MEPSAEDLILKEWPAADRIRAAGRCPCGWERDSMWSFVLPEYARQTGPNREFCGYYCASCKWSNAGTREIEPTGEIDCE